jgi:hypothetical protein
VTDIHVRLLSIAEQAGIRQHGSAIATVATYRPLKEDIMIRKRWIVAAMTLTAAPSISSALAHQPSATSASAGESLGRDGAARSASR